MDFSHYFFSRNIFITGKCRIKAPPIRSPWALKWHLGLLFGASNSFLEIEEKFLILQILQQK
jgi:hypothetical protein